MFSGHPFYLIRVHHSTRKTPKRFSVRREPNKTTSKKRIKSRQTGKWWRKTHAYGTSKRCRWATHVCVCWYGRPKLWIRKCKMPVNTKWFFVLAAVPFNASLLFALCARFCRWLNNRWTTLKATRFLYYSAKPVRRSVRNRLRITESVNLLLAIRFPFSHADLITHTKRSSNQSLRLHHIPSFGLHEMCFYKSATK